ncbi:uncharacterized protein LOC134707529 [Mytilus trossulus]|uniref:uncharacterized protein LOC134707529 n=1 Tax=Mytilus trossulus TaxID=6551 RepID=UPI003003B7E6
MKYVLHKLFTILILLLLLVTHGGTDDNCEGYYDSSDDTYTVYFCDNSTQVAAIISGVFGGVCLLVLIICICCLYKYGKRPGRVVNPTAVPTITQTQFGGTYGNNFSHNTPTQFGTQFTYGQQQQSDPYQQQPQPDPYAPPPAFTY